MSGDDLERLARIMGRLDDPEKRGQLRRRLEDVALGELADQEQEKLPGVPARVEPGPASPLSNPEMVDLLAAFLPKSK